MPTIHLIEGAVGAGKSTYAEKLSLTLAAPHLNLDAWMVTLFRPDRPDTDLMPWYAERKARCIEQIWRVADAVLMTGADVVLELGLVQRSDRAAFYARVDGTDHGLQVHVLEAPLAVRRQRVQQRNAERGATFQMEVPDAIFEMASAAWEAPDAVEQRERHLVIVDTHGAAS